MSWLARSIANSLKFDDDDEENTTTTTAADNAADPVSEFDQQPQSPSPSSTTPRGVKEDLADLQKTLTRRFWGVASFLAPLPESPSAHHNDNQTQAQVSDQDGSNDEGDDDALIAGIRSDFAEIGGKFKSGISKLSGNKTVSEITKMASNLLQFGSDSGDGEVVVGSVVGVTDEVVGFVRDIATHPETWLDFPVPDVEDFEDFDMSDTQQEHALAVERLAPRLAALRIELCPGYMSEGCFWKIYFVLLHPRLSKQDAELLSTPPIVEARRMLSYELHNKAEAKPPQVLSGIGSSCLKETADLPHEKSPSVPSCAESEALPLMASGIDEVPSNVAPQSETEKHAVQSKEIQIIDKAVVEEETVNQTKHQHTSSSSSEVLNEKFEEDTDDWLKDESSEMAGPGGVSIPIGNDDEVSFSDLEEDDGDEPTTYKKVTSGSDSSAKESRDWVQLSRSSTDSVKDINPVSVKRAWSDQVSARNSETKESNDWLDVDDIEM